MVEHQLPKLRVVGSSPIVRSKKSPLQAGFLYVSHLVCQTCMRRATDGECVDDGAEIVCLDCDEAA